MYNVYTMYPLHRNYSTSLPRKTITMKIAIFIIVCVMKSKIKRKHRNLTF